MALVLAVAAGCSGNDAPELTDSTQPYLGAEPAADANDLRLSLNTKAAVSGSLARGDERITFDLERAANTYVTTVHGTDGELLLRTTLSEPWERLELGSELSIDGPTGSVFNRSQPDLERVTVSGDLARATDWYQQPERPLVEALGAALAERSDVDPSIIPPLLRAADPVAASPDAETDIGTIRQPLATECGLCFAGCQADLSLCVAFAGFFYGFCIPPADRCMWSCVNASFCQ
jgi:hypothetical protein